MKSVSNTSRVKPQKHHYMFSVIVAVVLIAIAVVYYVNSSFSSVDESISAIEKMPNVKEAHFVGDLNQLVVTCTNSKQIQVELEDSLERYSPVIADFCK